MLPEEIKSQLEAMGQPAFRAKQIFKWLNSGVKSFDEMTSIPKKLAAELAESSTFAHLKYSENRYPESTALLNTSGGWRTATAWKAL